MNKLRLVIENFSPAWFAASMGTGGIANIFYQLSVEYHVFKMIGQLLWGINLFMFVLFLVPWVLRWFLAKEKVGFDLKHPMMSNFFVTMPVAMIILGTNFFFYGTDLFTSSFLVVMNLIIWVIGTLLTLLFSAFVIYNLISHENVTPEVTNFSWFIAPVANIVVPLLGNALVKSYALTNMSLASLINLIDLAFFGIGFTLFIMIGSLLLNRLIFHKMPHIMILPTFWIILGPIGVATITLFGLADASKLVSLLANVDALKLIGLLIWGFGFWAFSVVILVTIKYLKTDKLNFTLSWWAFIFPLAAYALSSFAVYQYTHVALAYDYAVFLTIIVFILWLLIFIKTIIGAISLKLLIPKQ